MCRLPIGSVFEGVCSWTRQKLSSSLKPWWRKFPSLFQKLQLARMKKKRDAAGFVGMKTPRGTNYGAGFLAALKNARCTTAALLVLHRVVCRSTSAFNFYTEHLLACRLRFGPIRAFSPFALPRRLTGCRRMLSASSASLPSIPIRGSLSI